MLISAQFRDPRLRPDDFAGTLRRLRGIAQRLADASGAGLAWYAQGMNLEDAMRYPAWEEGEPSQAILAMLKHEYRKDLSATSIGLWNGEQDRKRRMSVECYVSAGKEFCDSVQVSIPNDAILGTVDEMATFVAYVAQQFDAEIVSVAPPNYVGHKAFDNRPGVGWMLYLPHRLTPSDLPEAGTLMPVAARQGDRAGTIIVSETDGIFSLGNPRHIERANRIEIRLADLGVLPRYSDL